MVDVSNPFSFKASRDRVASFSWLVFLDRMISQSENEIRTRRRGRCLQVKMGVSDVVATGCDEGKIWNTGSVLYSRENVAGPIE